MKAYWVTGKKGAFVPCAEPTPLEDGRFCRVTDLEDGSIPVPTYGRTVGEVFEKIERISMHARSAVQSTRQVPPPAAPPAARPNTSGPARRLALTADETLLATSELSNPEKAGNAVRRLFENATGIDTRELAARALQERALAWEAGHPELKDNIFNKRLIMDNAMLAVNGNMTLITAEVLEDCYQKLRAGGYLLTEEDLPAQPPPDPALPVQPGENPASRTRQTPSGFATSHRLNRNSSPVQPPQWQPKYTREQIEKMPLRESEAILRAGGQKKKDYDEACNYWFSRQARA